MMVSVIENTNAGRIEFCRSFSISEDDWQIADISWDELVKIHDDHVSQLPTLSASASLYANLIQEIESVHSVRWRVKNANHLLAKIIRKRVELIPAYADISVSNYFDIVTDLVGIRALHLLKGEISTIHNQLNPMFEEVEPPVANIREGDPDEVSDAYRSLGLTVTPHPAGYRSIHYIKVVTPIKRRLRMEIQVRTVFEEGWSEIDHRVRYPNLSSDPLVNYASKILNRLSGMADEMSTYAMELTKSLSARAEEIESSKRERDDALERIEGFVREIEILKDGDVNKANTIGNLKREIASLQASVARDSHLNALAGLGASHSFLTKSLADALSGQTVGNALAARESFVEERIRGLGAAKPKKD